MTSFVNQALKGAAQNYHLTLLEKYQAVTRDEVLAALRKYVVPLFRAQSSVAIVVTAPGSAEDAAAGLRNLGFDVERRVIQDEPDEDFADGSESGEESESGSDGSR